MLTFPTAAATSADVPVMFISFDTVTVPLVVPAMVDISAAAIDAELASLITIFPV